MKLPKNYKYRPLHNFLTIRPSGIEGLGLYTLISLDTNTCLGITHVEYPGFENNMVRTPLGGFVNHSEDPNCKILKFRDFYKLWVIKRTEAMEELTVNYFESDCALNCGINETTK